MVPFFYYSDKQIPSQKYDRKAQVKFVPARVGFFKLQKSEDVLVYLIPKRALLNGKVVIGASIKLGSSKYKARGSNLQLVKCS